MTLMLFQQLQVEATQLKAKLRELWSNPVLPISFTSSSSSETTASKNNTLHSEYWGLGRQFAILSKLWVWCSALRLPCPINLQMLGPWHLCWCTNDAAWDSGISSELCYLLPSSYHELIESSALFLEEVCMFFKHTFIWPKLYPSSL